MDQLTKEQVEQKKFKHILDLLSSPEELRDWVHTYFDLYMPFGHISEEGNSSSVEAMWEIYNAVKNNTGDIAFFKR